MTLRADGVDILADAWNVKDGATNFTIVNADATKVWERQPDVPASITYSLFATVVDTVSVSWAAALRADDYTLEQSIDGGAWTAVTTTPTTTVNVAVSTEGNYTFRVRANNSGGSSADRVGDVLSVIQFITVDATNVLNHSLSADVTSGAVTLTPSQRFDPDGGCDKGTWGLPATVAIGDHYEVYFTATSNGNWLSAKPAMDAWIDLSAARSFTASLLGDYERTMVVTVSFTIRRVGTTSPVWADSFSLTGVFTESGN